MTHKVYCPTCEEIVTLRRKNFDHIYHEVLCFMVILTLGLGFIIYFILKYAKKPNTCPNCETEFDLKNLPKKSMDLNHSIGSGSTFIIP